MGAMTITSRASLNALSHRPSCQLKRQTVGPASRMLRNREPDFRD